MLTVLILYVSRRWPTVLALMVYWALGSLASAAIRIRIIFVPPMINIKLNLCFGDIELINSVVYPKTSNLWSEDELSPFTLNISTCIISIWTLNIVCISIQNGGQWTQWNIFILIYHRDFTCRVPFSISFIDGLSILTLIKLKVLLIEPATFIPQTLLSSDKILWCTHNLAKLFSLRFIVGM